MKKLAILILAVLFLSSFYQSPPSLKGYWIYAGDIFNGKKEGAPKEYVLEREYTDTSFAAYAVEKGFKSEMYETGKYRLGTDTCFETQTWSGQPSQLLKVTIHYHYIIRNDTLILHGVLPSGASTEEHWRRMK